MLGEEELREKVRDVLFRNMIKGYSRELGMEYHYTRPAAERYPFQYFWDSCFHVIMLVAIGEHEHAKLHLKTLFSVQEENGFVGNIIYWKQILPARITDFFQMRVKNILKLRAPHMSSIVQPPIAAQALLTIYEATGDDTFLAEMLPKLKLYYQWLAENRDLDGDALISIISPFESGMDWKPSYDVVVGFNGGHADFRLFCKIVLVDCRNFLRNYNLKKIARAGYFRVKDAGFNAVYARNLQDLALLCRIKGDSDGKIYEDRARRTMDSMVRLLYDETDVAFYDVYGPENKKIKILTPTIFYPVIVDHLSSEIAKNVMEKHFYKGDEFDTTFPIPSVAKNHPSFNPNESLYIWRGPVWIVHNWLMHKYLVNKGHDKKAEKLMQSMIALIEKSGFREYYNPFNGEGYGAYDFTWAGLVLDMIINKKRHLSG